MIVDIANWMQKVAPNQLTLRFKNHKVTVLLLVSPTEPFSSIKKTLLESFKSRGMKEINNKPIPEDPDQVELAIPIDKNNLDKGWKKLEVPSQKESGKRGLSSLTSQAASLKDSHAIAFRFRNNADADVDIEGNLDWDVVLPSYDEDEEQ